jgi:thymidylate synthase (FAD)
MIQYIAHMGDDDFIVARAAKSYDRSVSSYSEARRKRIIYKMVEEQAWTPFAHAQVSLSFEAPYFVARQLGRHQIGMVWSEVSRRYVNKTPEFYVPWEWRDKSGDSIGTEDFHNISRLYMSTIDTIGNLYKKLTEKYNITSEQARMILPMSTITRWDWTGSLVAWARVYSLRNPNTHTQSETQEYAEGIRDIIQPLFPIAWGALTS